MNQLTFFAEEPPARIIPLPDSASEWLAQGGSSPSHLLKSLHDIGPTGWFGRTSPASCQVTEDETLRDFWANSRARASKRPTADGRTAESSRALVTPTGSPTGCLTLSTSEHAASHSLSHNGAVVCGLSDILETGDVPQRFFLTEKACQGILRRAEKRGKGLPLVLQRALGAVAERTTRQAE